MCQSTSSAPRARSRVLIAISLRIAGCGSGGGGMPSGSPGVDPVPAQPSCEGATYASTFAAIQDVVFARHGCNHDVCTGSPASGGLDLRPDVAYGNLLEVPSLGSRW